MKKNVLNLVIILLSVVTLSSCGSLGELCGGGYYGGYYGNRVGYDQRYERVYGTQSTGLIGTAIQNKTGCWTNAEARISVTKETATKGLYLVTRKGLTDLYYLQPQKAAAQSVPEDCRILSARPYWNTFYDELSWLFYTAGQSKEVLVLNNGNYVRRK